MTYCVGLLIERGIVMLSDTRTNAGFDNIACYRKMFVFEEPGERVLVLMTAGNLSVTQTVIAKLRHEIERADAGPRTSVLQAETMLEAAEIVGRTLNDVYVAIGERMERTQYSASAAMLLGGQRRGGQMRLFLIYPEGNFIEATEDTPFLQIGDHKYGKPILDRVVRPETSLEDARKAVLISMDSTLRSNLSVGMPLDLLTIERDTCRVGSRERIEPGDPGFAALSAAWSKALRDGFAGVGRGLMPPAAGRISSGERLARAGASPTRSGPEGSSRNESRLGRRPASRLSRHLKRLARLRAKGLSASVARHASEFADRALRAAAAKRGRWAATCGAQKKAERQLGPSPTGRLKLGRR